MMTFSTDLVAVNGNWQRSRLAGMPSLTCQRTSCSESFFKMGGGHLGWTAEILL